MKYPEKLTLGLLAILASKRFNRLTAFQLYGANSLRERMSFGEFGEQARRFALALIRRGVKPGDRVLLLAENRPEWAAAYFGIALAGAVSIPVSPDCSLERVQYITAHAGPAVCCVTNAGAAKIAGVTGEIPLLNLDSFDEFALEEAAGQGDQLPLVEEEAIASIIYTSKGQGLLFSHRNLIAAVRGTRQLLKVFPRDRFLSAVSLAEPRECTLGLINAVTHGASTTYLEAGTAFLPAAQAVRPTAILAGPDLIEVAYRERVLPALKANPLYRFPLTRPLALQWRGRKLLSLFGGTIRFVMPYRALPENIEDFLRKVQFPYAAGYGVAEGGPILAGAGPYCFPPRSMGKPLKGVEFRVKAGEILARGAGVPEGCFQALEPSAPFSAGGWFRTGNTGNAARRNRLFAYSAWE